MNLGRLIAVGNTADLYLCDGKTVKLFHNRIPDAWAEHEAAKQRRAYSCGLSVPRVFDVCHLNGRKAIIMEHIEGVTLGELVQQNTGQADSYLTLAVDTQMEMHAQSVPAFESMNDRLTRQLQQAAALDDGCRAGLLERLAGLPVENKLCHGDFHPFNLIAARGKIYIIDWLDSSAGSPCADACRSHLILSQVSADLANRYLRLYCDRSGVSPDEIFLWAPIVAGARLSENVSAENTAHLLAIVRQCR